MKNLALLLTIALTGQVHAAKWTKSNNPDLFNPVIKSKMVHTFSDLPMKAQLLDARYGWSETYWPSNVGGIAYRWNHTDPQPFQYKFFSKDELRAMTLDELSRLSPSELYDVSMGDYSYSLTRKVLKELSPKDLWWEGICHGWALAASNYPEPDKTVFLNKDGITVLFGSSDVKALLSMHDAYNSKGTYVRLGDRCSVHGKVEGESLPKDGLISEPSKKDAQRPECSDVNAGAFHIVLTSMIGLYSHGFVADVDRFNDVWNQPVTGYESTVEAELLPNQKEMKQGIDRKIKIKTIMTYGEELIFYSEKAAQKGELGFVSKEPVTGTPAQTFSSKHYEYILELNRVGKIIGGEWISASRPDMLWMKRKDHQFNNGKYPLAGLNLIYKPLPAN
jgi:hypothetical protein